MIPDAWRRGEVAVVGLGRSGVAAGKWLAARGVRVYASDVADGEAVRDGARQLAAVGAAVETGRHDLERVRAAAAVIVSPGVPPDAPVVAAARDAGVEIIAELDLAVRQLGASKLAVVTGTNGKTTTTALLAHLLTAGGLRAEAAGNIGRPLTELASDATPPEWIAVEVSSFQLHDAPCLAPSIGVLTNLSPDHLDRYPDMEAYYADKRLLFRNASAESVWVLNADDAAVLALARDAAGAHRHWSVARRSDAWLDRAAGRLMLGDTPLLARGELGLLGDHNVSNALAAALAAASAGVGPADIARGLSSFRPPPHRLEPVGTVRAVSWINDSKATNVSAAAVALQAMTGPYVLIMGGRHKGEPYTPLLPLLGACRAIVAYGDAADRIATDLSGDVPLERVARFDDAVARAARLAQHGDAVLLSPACSSFDQFANFEHRGRRFRELVEAL
ncbi:MAG: UDP-N-acetylmuramoyl-L-alanine--D-glutamate ligase [Gemmatimonadota bacterium]|nr:MAG: UDP-N-acetylmuramoyl-L-alanine--D-glutamate ligase [Gemmatimonadota bacterium]